MTVYSQFKAIVKLQMILKCLFFQILHELTNNIPQFGEMFLLFVGLTFRVKFEKLKTQLKLFLDKKFVGNIYVIYFYDCYNHFMSDGDILKTVFNFSE